MDIIERIDALFEAHGRQPYEGLRAEPISALEHALQCAQLAEWAHADATLVGAALLHDIGHFVERCDDISDDLHELRALPLLENHFSAALTEPIRLHVQAKRYLVATDPAYAQGLSPASRHSLRLQGGPMNEGELSAFAARPYATEALALRRWDDLAKTPGQATPPLDYYLALLSELLPRTRLE
ncbi:phosphohydrolase [Paucibacter sp. APW11]|uniref:Phosphohydrolase n=1 Tax=Roseateles aquae TaxID=3077235 RepID=A0ABU3PJG7_9BURK|nr:phosphohydrolase [Paucibacter sp. APW11]MDT9002302.1 phosphohydrolase [Paucibacter sp. APW11]